MNITEAHRLLSAWKREDRGRKFDQQKAAMEKYRRVFHPGNIRNIEQSDFQHFLGFKCNRHWKGIQRHPNIYHDMERLQRTLTVLLDETQLSQPIEYRLDEIRDKSSEFYIKGLGRAVLTPILLCAYPDKYAVYNSISEEALKMLGRYDARDTDSFGKRYVAINKACAKIKQELGEELYLVDTMFARVYNSKRD